MSLRDKFLATDDLPMKTLDVPSWGPVTARALSAAEGDLVVQSKESPVRQMALAVSLGVCEPNGAKVFTAADVDALTGKSARSLKVIFDAVLELSQVTAAAVDDAEKKSAPTS